MEIERVNDYTVKFFISYRDIEDRGFNREEIWYDREQGEELFWEMMDEAADKGDFELEGPLWIQVQAFEKGLEIIVTKAKLSNDGSKLELPIVDDKDAEITIEYRAEPDGPSNHLLHEKVKKHPMFLQHRDEHLIIQFEDFEDIIQLARQIDAELLLSDLYVFEEHYFMYIVFERGDTSYSDKRKEDVKSQILEFGQKSKLTIHRLEEYGKRLMKEDAFQQIQTYFNT